jgi:hypothetical protein
MTGVLEREVLCVHLFLICMCKAECFELPIVIRKVPYNTLTARYPRECLCMPVHDPPIPFGLLQCMQP